MFSPKRVGDFSPIEHYAALSDGRTTALLAADGRIDWWSVPTLDAKPVCAALLDPVSGGCISLAPRETYEVERRYVEGTNVLESVYSHESGSARITSALNMASTGRLPWSELVFRVEGLQGDTVVNWSLVAGTQFGTVSPTWSYEGNRPVVRVGTQTLVIVFDGTSSITPTGFEGSFTVHEGDTMLWATVATDRGPVFVPDPATVERRLEATKENWRRWTELVQAEGPWRDALCRSALALKTLIAENSGAIAAAATTSLPEQIAGGSNWDYRYAWVRDSSFAIDALINLGLDEEAHNAVSWLIRTIIDNGPKLQVFYTLDGGGPENEHKLDAPGYRESQPVRSGNRAAKQLQIGNYGDVIDSVYRYVVWGNVLDVSTHDLLFSLAKGCCAQWRKPDSGIWELQKTRHYTISKIGCWVALDRLIKLVERGDLEDDHVAQWREERDAVRCFVEERCWSDEKQSYTFYADTDELDAAVLLSARTDFDVSWRLSSTIDAIGRELREGPLVYRFTGAQEHEGAFVACTFWLVEALAGVGRIEEATQLMDKAVALTNDVGLLSEEIDPRTGMFLGNVPQALSHLALINAAHAVRDATET